MIKDVIAECRERMDKTVDYFDNELRGIRTGRATTALIDHVKVDVYGGSSDLRELAAVSVPESTKLVVKPYDPSTKNEIVKAIESADLGLNPQVDGQVIYVSVPAPSSERRKQLVNQVKKMAEDCRVALRNERRDAMKSVEGLVKDKDNAVSEDEGKSAKSDIEDMIKKHSKSIDEHLARKSAEIEDV